MEIILLERIEKLGIIGDEVQVRPGYGRFLLKYGKALFASKKNKAKFDEQRHQFEAKNLELKQEAEKIAEKMKGLTVIVVRQAGESGHLYGSVNGRDIAQLVGEKGFTIGKNQVVLPQPIKELGMHVCKVTVHPEVSVDVTLNVARSVEEAKLKAEEVAKEKAEASKQPEAVFAKAEEQPVAEEVTEA